MSDETTTPKECYMDMSKRYDQLKIACKKTLDGHALWLESPGFLNGAEIAEMEPMLDGISAIEVAMNLGITQ